MSAGAPSHQDREEPLGPGSCDALRARIDRLREQGAARFDPPGHRLLEALLERAVALGGGAGDRVLARLAPRVGALERDLAAARAEAERRVVAARALGDPPPDLAEAFAAGDYRAAIRAADRWERELARGHRGSALRWAAGLVERARARGRGPSTDLARRLEQVTSAPGAVDPARVASARALANALSRALFRESAEAAHADLAVARATDRLPEVTGPYNADALATRALRRLSALSPAYLRAYLASLAELSSLEAALGPEEKPAKKRRRKSAAS